MNRMHPEDLRALVAGMHQAHDSLDPIGSADALLAELAKTTKSETSTETLTYAEQVRSGIGLKPEEPPTTPDWCMHIRRACLELRGARESQDQAWTRAEAAEARVAELEARNAQLLAQIAALLAAQTAQQHKQPVPIPFEWTCSTGSFVMLKEPKP